MRGLNNRKSDTIEIDSNVTKCTSF